MRVDLVASLPHYDRHLRPIWEALGSPGVEAEPGRNTGVALVASWNDANLTRTRKIYVEHGAGQAYRAVPGWAKSYYSGGAGHRRVLGFICPNEEVADRWRDTYPGVRAIGVGCPKLDRWVGKKITGPKTIALTCHWECTIAKETLPAFPYYWDELPELIADWRAEGFEVIGHAHPKDVEGAKIRWDHLKVEFVENEEEVFDRAGVLVADNTSLLPEFMALGRNVVFLDAPWYKAEHGGRFWDWTSGGHLCWEPRQLGALDMERLFDPDHLRVQREAVADKIYAYRDGTSSRRAADFVRELLEEA